MLKDAPALEGKALFDWLLADRPGTYEPGQVRTFQRRVKQWRALKGPDKEVFFDQEHRPNPEQELSLLQTSHAKLERDCARLQSLVRVLGKTAVAKGMTSRSSPKYGGEPWERGSARKVSRWA